jgi:hypothetical protein
LNGIGQKSFLSGNLSIADLRSANFSESAGFAIIRRKGRKNPFFKECINLRDSFHSSEAGDKVNPKGREVKGFGIFFSLNIN